MTITAKYDPETRHENLDAAVREYVLRRYGRHWPHGRRKTSAGKWHPHDDERASCCASIRPPSHGWPHSLLKHCLTADHVATKHGVSAAELRRIVRMRDDMLRKSPCAVCQEPGTDSNPTHRCSGCVSCMLHLGCTSKHRCAGAVAWMA